MNDPKEPEFIAIDLNSNDYDILFKDAKLFEKFAVVKARPANEVEIIITIVNSEKGKREETRNQAKEGDFIITNPGGEEYIVRRDKFPKLYEELSDGSYKSIGQVRAIQTEKNVEFTAPWGEKMKITTGSYLVDNNGERYGIDQDVFKNTYKPKL